MVNFEVAFPPSKEFLAGKGLARYRGSARFQPLPFRTTREVFPQAAHPMIYGSRRRWRRLSVVCLRALERQNLPIPEQPQNAIEVLVTPLSPTYAALFPSLTPRQKRSNLHLDIVPDLTEGAAGVSHPKVVDPAGKRSVDAGDDLSGGTCSSVSDDLSHFLLDRLARLLLRGHQDEVPAAVAFWYPTNVEAQKAKRLPLEQINHLRFLLIEGDPEWHKLLLEAQQSSPRPATLASVAADGDHNVIGKTVVVDGLVGPFRGISPDAVKLPVQVVQVDIRGQRAEGTSLRNPNFPRHLDNLLIGGLQLF